MSETFIIFDGTCRGEAFNLIANKFPSNIALEYPDKNEKVTYLELNRLADKIIKSKLVKSRVLRFHAFGFILQRQDDLKNKTFLKAFFEISKDKKVNEEINNLYNQLKD